MNRYEPFSTHRVWDALTHEAYAAQPVNQHGWHFELNDACTEAQKDQWRQWCKKYPNHWPGHVRRYIAERKRATERTAA